MEENNCPVCVAEGPSPSLDDLIARLVKLRNAIGGDKPVVLSVRPEDVGDDFGLAPLRSHEVFGWYEHEILVLSSSSKSYLTDDEGGWLFEQEYAPEECW